MLIEDMEFFIKKIFEGNADETYHNYFTRFGKGKYRRRFVMGISGSRTF